MADQKGSAGQGSGMNVDCKLVRELAELLADTGLTEIEVEDGERKIRVARGLPPVAAAAAALPAAGISAAAEQAATPPAPSAAVNAVKSPMVGTAYLSSEPGSPPFVKVGDTVKTGDTLLIVEAMKVMNPIVSTSAGTVQDILVSNAQPVEFDQPLIILG